MQITVIKVFQIIFVAASMVAGFLFYQRFSPEAFLTPEEEIIGEAQIQADPSENHTGKTAGEEIISTNIYGIKP